MVGERGAGESCDATMEVCPNFGATDAGLFWLANKEIDVPPNEEGPIGDAEPANPPPPATLPKLLDVGNDEFDILEALSEENWRFCGGVANRDPPPAPSNVCGRAKSILWCCLSCSGVTLR